MKRKMRIPAFAAAISVMVGAFAAPALAQETVVSGDPSPVVDTTIEVTQGANPILPAWEFVPDGEPRIFPDPETGEDRMYIYGSHDTGIGGGCGNDYVVWSAPVTDLNDWRYEGISLTADIYDGLEYVDEEGNARVYHYNERTGFAAPDVVYDPMIEKYVCFAFGNGDIIIAATSDSPAGPFEDARFVMIGWDPGVLVDGEQMYLYYSDDSVRDAFVVEIDPYTFEPKMETNTYMFGHTAPYYFLEASSIRKIGETYVFSYAKDYYDETKVKSDSTASGKLSEIAYATSDNPLTGWEYGGVIISNDSSYDFGEKSYFKSNNHGGLAEIDGQYYQIYHRSTNYGVPAKRQAMITPLDVTITENGVEIAQARNNSVGVNVEGLDPFSGLYAQSINYLTGNTFHVNIATNPDNVYDPDLDRGDFYPLAGVKNGNVFGYSYFNFGDNTDELKLQISIVEYQPAVVTVYASPYEIEDVGHAPVMTQIGQFVLTGEGDGEHVLETSVSALSGLQSIYFAIFADNKDAVMDINKLRFVK